MIGFKRVKNVKSKKRVFMITRPVPGAALSCQYIVLAYADVSSRKLTCNREGEVWRHVTMVALFLNDNKTDDDCHSKENEKILCLY